MQNYIYKQKNKDQAASNSLAVQSAGSKSIFQLQDNRPKSIVQKKQVEAMVGANPVQRNQNKAEQPLENTNGAQGSETIQMQRNHANRYVESNKLNKKIKQQRGKQIEKWEKSEPKRAKNLRKRPAKKKKKAANKKKAADKKKLAMKQKFMGLGNDKAWMEIIDGSFHHLGPQTFDEGLHAPEDEEKEDYAEPGYLDSIMKAREFVGNTMGEKMDDKYFERIHKLSAAHKVTGEDYHSGYRNENDKEVSVSYRAEEGDYVKGEPKTAIEELDPNVTRAFHTNNGEFEDEDMGEKAPSTLGEHDDLYLWYKTKSAAEVRAEVNKIMNFYYAGLKKAKNRDQALLLVATTHRKLENLHPFIDANSRTNRLILHKMLVENGMSPVILDNPLEVPLKSNAEWAGELGKGMQKWDDARKK